MDEREIRHWRGEDEYGQWRHDGGPTGGHAGGPVAWWGDPYAGHEDPADDDAPTLVPAGRPAHRVGPSLATPIVGTLLVLVWTTYIIWKAFGG